MRENIGEQTTAAKDFRQKSERRRIVSKSS
jgi:hypothetical protein